MKPTLFAPVAIAAYGLSVVIGHEASGHGRGLTDVETYTMKPVRTIQARVINSPPSWNTEKQAFVFNWYDTFDLNYRGGMDTVNTASIEGALKYVQSEGIDYRSRGTDNSVWCAGRKNGMKHIVFYELIIAQPVEAVAEFNAEFGPYSAMDDNQCTPASGKGANATFSKACHMIGGTDGQPKIGAYVGGEDRSTDPRAPYPGTWWFSYPNTCALKSRLDTAAKTEACRADTPVGLCPFDVEKPDGVACTFKYKVLGWVPIDDLVGITAKETKADATKTYKDFTEFCDDDQVEFNTNEDGSLNTSLPFWANPTDPTANSARAVKLVALYNDALAKTKTLTQVTDADLGNFMALPTVAELTTANPKCYENIPMCVTATHGCKRDAFSQVCAECTADGDGCVKAPVEYAFPPFVPPPPTTVPPTDTPKPSTTTTVPPPAAPTSKPTYTPSTTFVRSIHARVVSAVPTKDDINGYFVGPVGDTFEEKYRGAMDTVNTASVEGALMSVQAEGIDYRSRSETAKCSRKNGMKYVVFYFVAIMQPPKVASFFGSEHGPYSAMDGGQCTPERSEGDDAVFPQPCRFFNGTDDELTIGAYVGGEDRSSLDPRAPYPGAWWFSFPNTCPLKKWADKSDECRASTSAGLCPWGWPEPDGVTCTYSYQVLGWVPIDDLVGITAMTKKGGATYQNFSEFCSDGQVEFTTDANGKWLESIPFWRKPSDKAANVARTRKLVELYNTAVAAQSTARLTQVSAADLTHFIALPSVAELTTMNPPCDTEIDVCASAPYGCKREGYSQLCKACSASSVGCVFAPPKPTPTTPMSTTASRTPASVASSLSFLVMSVVSVVVSVALSLILA